MPPARFRPIEGFQTGEEDPQAFVNKCPAGANTSFPIVLGTTPSEELYNEVLDALTIEFQWATRTTPPAFTEDPSTAGYLDEGDYKAEGSNVSTLKFLNVTYTLQSVQIVNATHSSWILPTDNRANNKADLIVTFETNLISYKYLVFVIPIVVDAVDEGAPVSSPLYLQGIMEPSTAGSFSVQQAFPLDPKSMFAYYSTCLKGYTDQQIPDNIYVFVSISGIKITPELYDALKEKRGITGNTAPMPRYLPPFENALDARPRNIGSAVDFKTFVVTTTELLNFQRFNQTVRSLSQGIREDGTDAYKCIPLDPDRDVRDGKLQVNVDTGELLTNVMQKREELRSGGEAATKEGGGGLAPGVLEKYLAYGVGGLCGLLLVLGAIYWMISYFRSLAVTTPGLPAPPSPTLELIKYLAKNAVFATLAGFAGLFIGMKLSS
jgi:hypothetical protein